MAATGGSYSRRDDKSPPPCLILCHARVLLGRPAFRMGRPRGAMRPPPLSFFADRSDGSWQTTI